MVGLRSAAKSGEVLEYLKNLASEDMDRPVFTGLNNSLHNV